MLVLAVDTSAKVSSVSLVKDKQLLAITTLNTGNTHSETLLTSVNGLMGFANVSASDIDLFAVSAGPGSFTGIRIGVALVKGLAFGHKKCAGVSTLEALARNLEGQSGIICPVMDARRSQVYNALFKYENGRLVRLCEDRLITLEELKNELLTYNEDVRLVGDGYGIAEKYLADLRIINTPEIYRHQNAYSVAMCALDMYEKGEYCDDETLLPIYLRQPQAERERLERLNNAK
jgi:tRNA threonylcarbamoyladenosine biosynthesis protein TsaB